MVWEEWWCGEVGGEDGLRGWLRAVVRVLDLKARFVLLDGACDVFVFFSSISSFGVVS